MYSCLSSHSNIWVDKREESMKHSLFVNFHKFVVGSQGPADSLPVLSNHLLWVEWYSSTQKYCLVVLLQRKTVFLYFFNQKKLKTVPTINWSDILRRQFQWKSSSISRKTSTTRNIISDCVIDICNTHTCNSTFRCQRHFSSHFTFKFKLAWNVFVYLLQVNGPGVMMVNIGTRVAMVKIVFTTSRNAALIESKMLQYPTLSTKIHHCTLRELETQVFTISNVLPCLSVPCADQQQHSNPDFTT